MNGKQLVVSVLALGIANLFLAGPGGVQRPPRTRDAAAVHRRVQGRLPLYSGFAPHETLPRTSQHNAADRTRVSQAVRRATPLSLPMTFEPNVGQAAARVQFIGRGRGLTVFLMHDRIAIRTGKSGTLGIRFQTAGDRKPSASHYRRSGRAAMIWRGAQRLRGESNYLLGNDSRRWHTGVPHFSRAEAPDVMAGVNLAAYGNGQGLEYDLRLPPGREASKLRLRLDGARNVRLSSGGDLVMRVGNDEITMKKPVAYEQVSRPRHSSRRKRHGASRAGKSKRRRTARKRRTGIVTKPLKAAYVLESDGTIGFRIGPYDARATLVIDPSLSVAYATFLGGAGTDAATSITLDSTGKIYVGGTTTSDATFPEGAGHRVGPADGPSEFFIAKIDPTVSGPNSLVYLTFLGGSGAQTGGLIAVDGSGDIAITGTTTSTDFPVTDTSQPTNGLTSGYGNDVVVSEIDPTGTKLMFSTLFGGSGTESRNGTGGIAIDSAGDVYIASDTNTTPVDTSSPDLPVTTGALQTVWDGQLSDGFMAIFQPPSQAGGAATLKYCSYLGTNSVGAPGVGGVAVDNSENVYIAGFTANSVNGFPTKNALQSSYGGGTADAFLMKISPQGGGSQDLVYATLLGGSGTDEALAVAVDSATTPNAYVTGMTQSPNFPTNGATAAYQPALNPTAQSNAFFAVVAQDPISGQTSLAYSTYLGGSAADTGQGIAVGAPNAVYIAGGTTSFDFPWRDNLQPFNGAGDAFVAKLDPTSAGTTSLVYATPLGGTSPPGGSASASAAAVAADDDGHAYVAGITTSGDFPTAVTTEGPVNGFQQSCSSCTSVNPASDAFVAEISESATPAPSVTFTLAHLVFSTSSSTPQFMGVLNAGEAPLVISSIGVTGPNAADFSLIGQSVCVGQTINPGPSVQCSFEVTFSSSGVGPEFADVSITDNAPGSPQVFEMTATGGNVPLPLAVVSPASVSFGNQPQNTTSAAAAVTVTNAGNESLNLAGFSVGGTDLSQFQLAGGGSNGLSPCQGGAALPNGASCVVQVAFAPISQGSFHAELDFFDNSGNVANAEQVVPLTGSGIAQAPIVSLGPSALAFGTEPVGSTTGPQSVTLANNGSAALNLTSIGLSGLNAADFAIASTGTSCPPGGGSLASGANCNVAVQFAPQTAGSKNASLTFNDNAAGSPQQVSLSGTGAPPPSITVSPSSLTFASQSVGTTSSSQFVTVSNTGGSTAGIGAVSISPATATEFTVPPNPCPAVAAGGSCQIAVSFQPTAPGVYSATLTIVIPGGSPATVALSGTATQASISVPASVNFGSQLAGISGTPQPIVVTNNSSGVSAGALTVFSVTKSGVNAGDFAVTADSCTGANTPPGATCTLLVAFVPACSVTQSRSATLTLNDNAPGSPQNVQLNGTASGFCLRTASGQSISETTPAGQSATYSLELDSPGSSGSVALACTNPPPLGACTVGTASATSPLTVQISPGLAVPFPVEVTTTASGATGASDLRPKEPGGQRSVYAWPPGSVCVAAFLLACAACTAGGKVRRRPGLVRVAQACALLLLFAVGMAACGGGGAATTSDPSPGTPANTYTLDVTATLTPAGQPSVTQTLPLTLTVQ